MSTIEQERSEPEKTLQEQCYGTCWAACNEIESLQNAMAALKARTAKLEEALERLAFEIAGEQHDDEEIAKAFNHSMARAVKAARAALSSPAAREDRQPESRSARIDPGKGWRLLSPGELAQEGDEIWLHGNRWGEIGCRGSSKCAPLPKYVYRRRMEKDAAPPTEGGAL